MTHTARLRRRLVRDACHHIKRCGGQMKGVAKRLITYYDSLSKRDIKEMTKEKTS